jgi:small-conductance mechanosensitive channel
VIYWNPNAMCPLSLQVQFQHNELLNARDKIKRLESKMTKDAQEREQTLTEAQARVRRRHKQFQAKQAAFEEALRPADSTPAQIQELTQELQFDTNAFWWNKMPKLMEVEASLTMLQVQAKSLENDQMERIIRGYQQFLGDVPECGNLEESSSNGATVAEQQDPETTDQHSN